jgi:hypothetical protein
MTKAIAFRIMLAAVGLAHLALGLAANLGSQDTLGRIVTQFYGASLDVNPQMHHVLRILGVFMIGIGMMAIWACGNPQRHQAVVLGLIAILVLRVLQRIMLAKEIESAFNISPTRIWVQAGFFLAAAVLLFVLRPTSSGGSGS